MPNYAMPATFGTSLPGLSLNPSPCPGASLSLKESNGTQPLLAKARHWSEPARPNRARTCQSTRSPRSGARQYGGHSSDAVLPLHPYLCDENRHLHLYLVDTLKRLRPPRHRRPRRNYTAHAVTELACARATLSRPGRSSCTLSIA